jgi:hypothetical protein
MLFGWLCIRGPPIRRLPSDRLRTPLGDRPVLRPAPPPTQENRSPIARTPARSGFTHRPTADGALAWGRGKLLPEHRSQATHASHCVVYAPLEASRTGAFLVGTRSLGRHDDHAIISSTSWSYRSSMLWMSPSLPFLRAHSR